MRRLEEVSANMDRFANVDRWPAWKLGDYSGLKTIDDITRQTAESGQNTTADTTEERSQESNSR